MSFLSKFKSNSSIKASGVVISAFLILVYVARPVPLPIIKPQNLVGLSGMPKFDNFPATRSAVSESIFHVNGITIYCGVGIIQGSDTCFYIEELINKKINVSINYFLMSNRLGFKYPVLYSLEQEGVVKITPKLAYSELQASAESAWKNYYMLLFLFGSLSLFLIAIEQLQKLSKLNKGKENDNN